MRTGGKIKVKVFLPLLIVSFLFFHLLGDTGYSLPSRGDIVSNGSFENNADNWIFAVVSGASIGAWDNSGYESGGCVKIVSGQTVTTHYYAENLGETTWNTDTSYQDKVTLAFVPPVTENYLIIASAEVAGSSEDYQTWASLEIDNVIYQELKYRIKDATDYYPFNALKRISLIGGSPHIIKVKFKTNNTGGIAKIRNARLLVWKVACEYAENEGEFTTTSTSPENVVTLTFTPSSAADYLIVATANIAGAPGLQYSTLNCLTIDGENFASTSIEPSDDTAYYNFGTFKKVNLSGGVSHAINLQIAAENQVSGYSARIKYAHITAIRLDSTNYYAENEEELKSTSANTWYLALSNTFNSEADNYLSLGTLHYMPGSANYSVGWRLNADTTTAQDLVIEGKDSTDYESAFTMSFGNLEAGSHTDNLEYIGELPSAGVKNRRLICIQVPVQRESGEGYWEQTLGTSISSGSTVKLCYAWRKGYVIAVPEQQNIYVTIVKPDNSTIDVDCQIGPPEAYDNWFIVDNKEVSSYFDQTGNYKIRLRYIYETGSDLNAQCVCRFDEVKLFIIPPRDVDLSVSPSYQSGLQGTTLNYTITIANMGNLSDTYDLVASDNLGWGSTVYPTSITVLPGTTENATLSVTVPTNAMGCALDNITVTATSQTDNTVSDFTSCIAHATIVRSVEVSILPRYQSGVNGEILDYIVTVSNIGNVEDTYSLAAVDNAGWAPTVFPGSLTVPPWENKTTTLRVTVPSNAIGCTEDLITLTARSQADNTIENSDNCVAHATMVRRVKVSISPSYQSGLPGTTLNYVVTVTNTGNVSDTYDLTASDNLGWGLIIFPASITVSPATSENVSLNVTVPPDAIGCSQDNITVTTTSQADNTVSNSDSCIAHASIVRGVDISISPSYQSGLNGSTLYFSVTVANTGNILDTYDLVASDNSSWSPTVSPTSITVQAGASDIATLSVTVPLWAIGCTEDNIVVIATSRADNMVRYNDSCIAHATIFRGVDVSISPSYQDGAPESTISYAVVVANTGNVTDTYELVVNDSLGWSSSVLPTLITVLPSGSDNATLSVNVPAGAENCTKDNIVVNATSKSDNTVSGSDSCIAHAIIILGVDTSISPGYQSNLPGETLYYTAIVTNIGNVPDNYDLSVSDNSGWSLNISPTSVAVPAGASDNVMLSVVIPPGAENCTRDNITVTATSRRDNSVSDSASCIAHARVGIDPHAPIYMIGNDNFTLANGVTSGSGTAFDPYIIQNWEINTSSADGIEIKNTTAYFVIRNCRVYVGGYTNYGIYFNHAANGRIENTLIYSDNTGIYLYSSSNNTIKNCRTYYNFVHGIQLNCSDNNILSNCTTSNNTNGIYLQSSSNNIIEKCVTSSNDYCGIFIRFSSDNNTVSNCNSSNNFLGIYLGEGSDNNHLYHNKLINNTNQAYDNGSNYWDDGYPSGGNYWSDYSGWDKNQGEKQDIPGSDGIGDTPYNISGGVNQDRYPLVTKSFELSVTPEYKEGTPREILNYTVTVVNTGNATDNYAFEVSDNAGWGLTINPPFFVVYPGNSEDAILNVTIPDNAQNCTRDEVLVVARSQTDSTISDSGSCIAHAVIRGVKIMISPEYLSGLPGATLTFSVTIANTGLSDENYSLSTSDNLGWGLSVSPTLLSVRAGDNGFALLTVTIPASASSFTEDNITVIVTSKADNTVRDNDTCIAVAIVRNVKVSISPDYQEGLVGSKLNYFITVVNTGETVDNFALSVSDNRGWGTTLSENLLENVQIGENRMVTLSVIIPEDAVPFTEDNLTVTAASLGDQTVSNSDSCVARVLAALGVDVVISPDYQSTHPGTEMNFTITISNIGANVDNYTLVVSDNAGWALTILENLFENVMPNENRITTLIVTIPDNVTPCTEDNVCVTVTSMENAEVSVSDWCIAHAMAPKAEFSLVTLFQVSLDMSLFLKEGSKLVVKFYTYENTFENENIIEEFPSLPWHVEENENARHPGGTGVKRARLDLTGDNTENVILTITSFLVKRDDLWFRLAKIRGEWPYAMSLEKDELWRELSAIRGQWPYAPS